MLKKEIERLLLYDEKYIITKNYMPGQINIYKQWLKWLRYIPEFQKVRIAELKAKPKLSKDEQAEYEIYERNASDLKLLENWFLGNCTPEERVEVYNICNGESKPIRSISKLIKSKLTNAELTQAVKEVKILSSSEDAVNDRLKAIDKYMELSMTDAYILEKLTHVSMANSIRKTKDFNSAIQGQNEAMAYQNASKSFCKRNI